uniref:Putative secreted protein n=1 Tax=Anopheles marajoara TaxID=58244 RepID=A0A2M4C751_9DIPT
MASILVALHRALPGVAPICRAVVVRPLVTRETVPESAHTHTHTHAPVTPAQHQRCGHGTRQRARHWHGRGAVRCGAVQEGQCQTRAETTGSNPASRGTPIDGLLAFRGANTYPSLSFNRTTRTPIRNTRY